MGDYFLGSGYIDDLQNQVDIDPLLDSITVSNSIFTSNVSSSNADIGILESYILSTTYGYTSNLLSSNVQTTQLSSKNASLCNLTFSSGLGSNLILTDLGAGLIDAYDIQTSILTCTSNLTASSILANYFDATTVLGSNIYLLGQLLNESNQVVIDSNSKISWNNLKDIPESNGLDILALAQGAYDLAQLGYDMYQQLQSLLGNTPKLPDNIKDPISDALGSNDNGTSNIYVDWSKLTSRPFSTNGFDVGIQSNLFFDETNAKIFSVPHQNFSKNNTNVYATTTTSNLVLDVGRSAAYLSTLSMGSNQFSSSNVQLGMINLAGSGISTSCNVSLNISSPMITNNITNTSNISTKFISTVSLCNYITSSNGSNSAQDMSIASSCNLNLSSFSNGFVRISASNFTLNESNFRFIQACSNPSNPFLPYSVSGIQANTSNVILKVQNMSNSSTIIQDYGQVNILMTVSNGSNMLNQSILINSNCDLSNVSTLYLKSNLSSLALATTNSNVFVNSNLSTGKDLICGGVVRSSVVQIGSGLQATGSMTSGLYGDNARLIIDSSGTFYPNDAVSFNDLTSGTVSMNTIPSTAGWKGSFSTSLFKY